MVKEYFLTILCKFEVNSYNQFSLDSTIKFLEIFQVFFKKILKQEVYAVSKEMLIDDLILSNTYNKQISLLDHNIATLSNLTLPQIR